jgi:cytoskeletal protein RodZ
MAEDDSILGLATIRRNRGISLEQISETTKISMRSLRAIESGDFQKLPGGIYSTSYIRQYAKAIDFDETELLAFYRSHAPSGEPELPRPPRNGNGIMGGGYRPASIAG